MYRGEARIADRERVVEVVRPIESRVGAAVAVTCDVDHSPPPVVIEVRPGIMAVRGEGRPSKRLRRDSSSACVGVRQTEPATVLTARSSIASTRTPQMKPDELSGPGRLAQAQVRWLIIRPEPPRTPG